MNHDAYSDAYIRDILAQSRTIAMVGASPNTSRPSYFAMKYLKQKGFIEVTEHGTVAITVEGIDHVISLSRTTAAEKLLIGQSFDRRD